VVQVIYFPTNHFSYLTPLRCVEFSVLANCFIELTGVLSHEQTKQKGYPQPRDVPSCCLTTCGLLIPVSPCQLLPLFLSSSKTAVWPSAGYWT